MDHDAIKLPEFDMMDVLDYYTMYVGIMGMSEDVFWHSDIAFVRRAAANKQQYDRWMYWQTEKKRQKISRP